MAWAQTSTLVAIALGNALDRKRGKASLGLRPRRAPDGSTLRTGIVVCVVSETGALDPSGLAIRVWEAGDTIPADPEPLRKIRANLVELVAPREPGRYWVSLERAGEGRPLVFAVTVLHDRLATIVVQITAGIRLLQHQPATDARRAEGPTRAASSTWSGCCSRADSTGPASSRSSWPRRATRSSAASAGTSCSGWGSSRSSTIYRTTARAGAEAQRRLRPARRARRRDGHDGGEAGVRGGRRGGRPRLRRGPDPSPRGPSRPRRRPPTGRGRALRLPEPHARIDVVGLHPAPVHARDAPGHGRRHRLRGIGSRRATGSRTRCIERGGGSTRLRPERSHRARTRARWSRSPSRGHPVAIDGSNARGTRHPRPKAVPKHVQPASPQQLFVLNRQSVLADYVKPERS